MADKDRQSQEFREQEPMDDPSELCCRDEASNAFVISLRIQKLCLHPISTSTNLY
jgi:hypothetical protein